MRLARSQGASRRKLATDFGTSQWMAARLTGLEPAQLATNVSRISEGNAKVAGNSLWIADARQ